MRRMWFLLGLSGIVAVSAIFPTVLKSAYLALGATWQVVLNLLTISGIAILFAAFLSPLEALGWWAGWYGDTIEEMETPAVVERPIADPAAIRRYVIYLDGIGQATSRYLPDVEEFLDRLEAALPESIVLLRGIMPYSAINRELTDDDRLLSWLWRLADYMQVSRYGSLMGTLTSVVINIRNALAVAVSADKRYGPIYNQGTAQVIYNSLVHYGYQAQSSTPITLIGYSGGGQIALGAIPFLKQALGAPIEVISIAGVFSGSEQFLQVEHLYHLVGDKDPLERLGPIMFPKRWQVFSLSYWNRAKRQGKVSFTSLGPVGHSGPGSAMDDTQHLPDGRTFLEQTLEYVTSILLDRALPSAIEPPRRLSNYEQYKQAEFNQPGYYPIGPRPNPDCYRPIARWMGRLILPAREQRSQIQGVLFEVHHAPQQEQHLIGQVVKLRWQTEPQVQAYVRSVRRDMHFSSEAKHSQRQGVIHPVRLNHWQQVGPLESLAGAHPEDDVIVRLHEPVQIESDSGKTTAETVTLLIAQEPVQITGRFYALVKIVEPLMGDRFQVVHFNRESATFDGRSEIVRLPPVIADRTGIFPSSTHHIEQSSLNGIGWYIYGALDREGMFVVQAIAPRALRWLQPSEVLFGETLTLNYLKKQVWANAKEQKGEIKSVLLCPIDPNDILKDSSSQDRSSQDRSQDSKTNAVLTPQQAAIAQWAEGERALVIHTYGGIGGKKREPAASSPIFFGHFAYGVAQVVREPLADELQFEIEYHQVYTHNTDGLTAGTLSWARYVGDRQFGWLGTRPLCDVLIKLDAFTEPYEVRGLKRSVLDVFVDQLDRMCARYRIGDGTGGTYVGPVHNCAQDSNQALYAALKDIQTAVNRNPDVYDWLLDHPNQAQRFGQLMRLMSVFRRTLLPLGAARADRSAKADMLGISPEEDAIVNLLVGLRSWRTLLPRLTSETVTRLFLQQQAQVWVLRTNQVGGDDPDIEPIAPTPIGW